MRIRTLLLTILFFIGSQANAGELVVVQTVNPYDPAHPMVEASYALHVYALPGFGVVASNPQITGLTTVSNDGTRLYELDLIAHRIRTFDLPSLQLIADVPSPPAIPWIDQNGWIREHPHRPGILILKGTYWMDARNGNWVETPTSLRVPAPSPYASQTSISGDRRKLVVSYYGSFSGPEPSGVKIIDLDNPRLVQALPADYRGGVLMEPFGFVALDADHLNIQIRDIDTQALLHTIAPPPGLRFRGDFAPINSREVLHSAWSEATNEQILLRLDLGTKTNSERFRQLIDDNHPEFGSIEARGERVLLAARTEHPGFMGQPYSTGQMREINLTTGASTTLLWPVGGGPVGGGAMLATGSVQPIPFGAWTSAIIAFVLLVLGLQGIQHRNKTRNVRDA